MEIFEGVHLTYCSNIHAGENFSDILVNIEKYTSRVKQKVSPDHRFGVGLWISNKASIDLMEERNLNLLKSVLLENGCYVFTINGFPYGNFHDQVIKDHVHTPDWTTSQRYEYMLRLIYLLKNLLPEGVDGSISTSPLSYFHWHTSERIEEIKIRSAWQLARIAEVLHGIEVESATLIHLNLEPEPDGLLENAGNVIHFYEQYLHPAGNKIFPNQHGSDDKKINRYIRICYDVCHFAMTEENPEAVFQMFASKGILIGKVQLSSALQIDLTDESELIKINEDLESLNEEVYLHQVVEFDVLGQLKRKYRDLPFALPELKINIPKKWIIHFHVPLFANNYERLSSTNEQVQFVMKYIIKHQCCSHLEVETYTWKVLPPRLQTDLTSFIIEEIEWVKKYLKKENNA